MSTQTKRDKRDYVLHVRLSGDEFTALQRRAGHEPLSSYVRRCVVSGVQVVAGEAIDKPELIGERKPVMVDVRGERPKPKRSKWENRYCKEHHVMGCEACV